MNIPRILFLLFVFAGLMSLLAGCDRQTKVDVKKQKVGDIELAYYIRGNGEPLVMIMGFRGTMGIWDPALLELLEKKYTLILFDNRGAGFSTDTEKNLTTISQMAEDTAKLIKSLGYQKVHVLGWSMGSRIALDLALKFPEIVDNLILCSPNPGGEYQSRRKTPAYKQLTATELSKKEGLSIIFPQTAEGRDASAALVDRLTKAVLKREIPDDMNVSSQTVERQVHALKLWDEDNQLYEQLSTIKIPTLVAGGLSDVLDNPENVQIVASRIPFAWSAYFANSGHYFLSQDHKNCADLITLFLESDKKTEREK